MRPSITATFHFTDLPNAPEDIKMEVDEAYWKFMASPGLKIFHIHSPFFPAKRQIFPSDSDRTGWYILSSLWFLVGPTVHTCTTNVPIL